MVEFLVNKMITNLNKLLSVRIFGYKIVSKWSAITVDS